MAIREIIAAIKTPFDLGGSHVHGTAVSSLVALGPGLNDGRVRIISHKILSPDVWWFPLAGMFDAIRTHRERTRLFLSSVNIPKASSRTLARLDNLVQKTNICFVNSGGNIDDKTYLGQVQGRYPDYLRENHVFHPAQNIHVLSVGAVANRDNATSIARTDGISPFSRCGAPMDPGVDIRKPDVVDYGGNLSRDTFDFAGLGVEVLDRDGQRREIVGTSFSAPLVVRMLAALEAEYGSRCQNSETLKALLFAICTGYQTTCYGLGRVGREVTSGNRRAVLTSEGIIDMTEAVEGGMTRRNRAQIAFRVPRGVDKITLFVVHSDDYPAFDHPTLDTFMRVRAFKDGRESPVPMSEIGSRRSYVKVVRWWQPGHTMLGRWSFQLYPEARGGLLPSLRRRIQVRFGSVFLLESSEPRTRPLTDAFIEEARRIESAVVT